MGGLFSPFSSDSASSVNPAYSEEGDVHRLTIDARSLVFLRSKLRHYNPPNGCGDSINILLFGLVGAGKSATINTILSALDPEYETITTVPTGRNPSSLTAELRSYTPPFAKSLKLWDTAGWNTVNDAVKAKKILEMILEGRVPEKTNLCNLNPDLDDGKYQVIPENVIHVVAFIVDLNTIDNISGDMKTQFKDMQTIVVQKHIYRTVIGTKFDRLGIPEKDNSYIYQYMPLQKKFVKLSEETGMEKHRMFAISNEWKGDTIDQTRCVLILHALENMVGNINEHFRTAE
ncbi:interferon-induced protein 44-like isoform X2 [Carcharodon carcharias]|uniref:interferon-induced protein 44-like isoform X2 n=1 Tax=Carcharodon carcharias TaxID=13397 RepID=UPI001B7E825C|nr:interferon-induced protein 44-like isoform X2 [Carcharodon carcharias]